MTFHDRSGLGPILLYYHTGFETLMYFVSSCRRHLGATCKHHYIETAGKNSSELGVIVQTVYILPGTAHSSHDMYCLVRDLASFCWNGSNALSTLTGHHSIAFRRTFCFAKTTTTIAAVVTHLLTYCCQAALWRRLVGALLLGILAIQLSDPNFVCS